MAIDVRKWLFDALEAARAIETFVEGRSYDDYLNDLLLRSAVERQFEIVGESLKRIRDYDESCLQRISGWRGAISFRNILSHGYDSVDDELVWGIIENDLPSLLKTLSDALHDAV